MFWCCCRWHLVCSLRRFAELRDLLAAGLDGVDRAATAASPQRRATQAAQKTPDGVRDVPSGQVWACPVLRSSARGTRRAQARDRQTQDAVIPAPLPLSSRADQRDAVRNGQLRRARHPIVSGESAEWGIIWEFLKEVAICLSFDTHIPGSAKVLLWPARRRLGT